MRKANKFIALAMAGVMMASTALSVSVASAADDYTKKKVSNGNDTVKKLGVGEVLNYERYQYTVYATDDNGKVTRDVLKGTGYTRADVYGVRFFTNMDYNEENNAGNNGCIQIAHDGPCEVDAKGEAVVYKDTVKVQGVKKTVEERNGYLAYYDDNYNYYYYKTEHTKFGLSADDKGKMSGTLYTADGQVATGVDRSKLTLVDNPWWWTIDFGSPKYATYESEGKTYTHKRLFKSDGSVDVLFKQPIATKSDNSLMFAYILWSAANDRYGVGVTAVQILGKDGKVLYTDTSMGNLSGAKVSVPKKLTMAKGSTAYINGEIKPQTNGAGIYYSSDKPSVVKVQTTNSPRSNQLKALKAGTAKITAQAYTRLADGTITTAGGKKATIKVTVKPAPKKIKISNAKKVKSLKVGKKITVKYTLKPKNAYAKVTYKSSKKKVATISKKGVLKAKKAGTTTITLTTDNKKKAKLKVKVKK